MRSTLVLSATLLAGQLASQPAIGQPVVRSLDQALVQTLSLGNAQGCGPALGVPDFGFDQEALDTFLAAERDAGRLGKELAAICGSSAVASAASLGGSLGTVQATKTVSQFREARSRTDSRLKPGGKRAGQGAPILLAQAGGGMGGLGLLNLRADADGGLGAFAQVEHETRSRSASALEAGYRADTTEAAAGLDWALPGDWLVGGWLGWRGTSADYRAPGLVVGGADNGFGSSLDAATQAAICRIGPGGGFNDRGLRAGAFVARRMGQAFADLGLQYGRRNYHYNRSVCAIEGNPGALVADAASPSGFASDGIAIDDVYAGSISGKTRLTEWAASARAGIDFGEGAFSWGPRLGLTYARTTIGAYTETGRTSVSHTVRSNNPNILQTVRAAGDPTGLELAFDGQRRTSLQSELQLVAALRHPTASGTWVPRLALSWVHEFKADRQAVVVRMAQDLRATPTRFGFSTDAPDANRGVLALGLRWEQGTDMAADLEVRRQFGDALFEATSLGLRAFWRF